MSILSKLKNKYYSVIYPDDDILLDALPATPELVANRFISIFKMHGIQASEIPEIEGFQNISLYDLNSTDRLLQKLTPDFLKTTAEFFGVRIEWLRSGEPDLYQQKHWYKNLTQFFEDLKDIDFDKVYDPLEIITIHDQFDIHSNEYQPFILVLKKHIAEIDDRAIFKFYVESEWDWHHPPCRLQAKAIATKYYQLTHRMIPIYKVDKDTFQRISHGYISPETSKRKNHKVSFEEYGALNFNHLDEPYEKEERDAVLEEMKYYKIDGINYQYVDVKNEHTTKDNNNVEKSKAGRKPDIRKRELKERFVAKYHQKIQLDEISRTQAAEEFYKSLSPDEEKVLLRSTKNYDHLNDNKLEELIVRTIKEFYRDYEKIIRNTEKS